MRGLRQWAAVAVGTGLLCAAPALVGLRPVGAAKTAPTELLRSIRASGPAGYSGLAESRGNLGLPSLPRLGALDDLLSGTVRARVWYAGPENYRVDRLTPIGEEDTVRDPLGSWDWSAGNRTARRVPGRPALRLPQPYDLLPPQLARRLAAPATVAELSTLPPKRIAGRGASGLRITPAGTTTLGRVDIWADPGTGVALRVDVTGRGETGPSISSAFLDVRLGQPREAVRPFEPPLDAQVDVDETPDLVAAIDRFSPYQLPDRLAGLARTERVSGLTGGVATYGDGYALLAVLPLQDRFAGSVLDRLSAPPGQPVKIAGARAAALVSPLVATVVVVSRYQSALVAGTVPLATLTIAARELAAQPLPLRSER